MDLSKSFGAADGGGADDDGGGGGGAAGGGGGGIEMDWGRLLDKEISRETLH